MDETTQRVMDCERPKLTGEIRCPMEPLSVDVASLFERLPITAKESPVPGLVPAFQDRFHRFIYRRPQLSLKFRVKAKGVLRRTNLDIGWLKHFESYWFKLGGRPLWHVSEFFFLRNIYRHLQVPPADNTIKTAADYLPAWQDPRFLYGLFQAVLRETFFTDYRLLRLLGSLKRDWSSLLEYGAGAAPLTDSILQFGCGRPGCVFTIADLATLPFHYAAYKFRRCSNVEPILLKPEDEFQLITTRQFDVIFCCQVFEHINRPLETVKRLNRALKPGGIFFFDYIKNSEARGLDSVPGLVERESVLDYISSEFLVEYGALDKSESMGLTVVRKRN